MIGKGISMTGLMGRNLWRIICNLANINKNFFLRKNSCKKRKKRKEKKK
jgi:hypothetical protein